LKDKLPDPSPRRDPNDNIKFEEEAVPVFEDSCQWIYPILQLGFSKFKVKVRSTPVDIHRSSSSASLQFKS
jgi:hypothetical protein